MSIIYVSFLSCQVIIMEHHHHHHHHHCQHDDHLRLPTLTTQPTIPIVAFSASVSSTSLTSSGKNRQVITLSSIKQSLSVQKSHYCPCSVLLCVSFLISTFCVLFLLKRIFLFFVFLSLTFPFSPFDDLSSTLTLY